jgi:hypothetical protein
VAEDSAQRQKPRRRLRNFLRHKKGASRSGFGIDRSSLKDGALFVLPFVLLIIAAFWFAARYVRPAPPDTFVMSTGAQGGAYNLFGQRYREILARDGVHIELRASAGSIENRERLADPSADVEAAFMQSGVATPEAAPGLVSLGSIYYEPLWIFYRSPNEITLSDEARRYFKTGPPFLRRYLPFWLANPVERMLVLLVPLFVVLVPAIKVLPALMQWRVRSRVFRWYGEIKFLEAELLHDPDSARIAKMLARLDEIERGVARTSVPRAYTDYSYNLRMHIEMVRNRMIRFARAESQASDNVPDEPSHTEQHRSA